MDGVLPLSRDTSPRVLFRGDTLFVLQQRLAANDRAETSVTGYLLNTHDCQWLSVAG